MIKNSNIKKTIYEFGDFRLIPSERLLLKNNQSINLAPKVFDALVMLVEHHGHLIEKNAMLDKLWEDEFVEEATLARTISRLRKALVKKDNFKFIETIPKKGYRFSANVTIVEEELEINISKTPDSSSNKDSDKKTALSSNEPNDEDDTKWQFGLKHVLLGGAFIGLITLAIFYWQYNTPTIDGESKIKSIAVLPFKFLEENQRDKALELGMADTLITKLSNIEKIIIRPTRAIFPYAEKDNLKPAEVGRELQVDATLNGTIQKVNQRLRINIQLINSADGTTLWTKKFDIQEKDIFALQDDISTQVANALQLELSGTEQKKLAKNFTENPQAYKAYIEGRLLWSKRNPKDFEQSLKLFEKAIEIDENYALAYTGVADSYQLFTEYRLMPINEGFAKARNAARKALELDESLAEAHASLGYTLAFYDWDFDAAEKEFKRAIELNPNYATARQWYAEYLVVKGRFEESYTEIKKAQELNPLSPSISADVTVYYFMTEKYDQSIEFSKKTIELEPNFSWGYRLLSASHNGKGEQKETVYAFLKVIELSHGEDKETIKKLKDVFDKNGWKAFWQAWIKQMNSSDNIYLAWDYAISYLRFGDKENSLKWLENSYENRDRWVINIKYEPRFIPLRSEPRFQDLVKRIGL